MVVIEGEEVVQEPACVAEVGNGMLGMMEGGGPGLLDALQEKLILVPGEEEV